MTRTHWKIALLALLVGAAACAEQGQEVGGPVAAPGDGAQAPVGEVAPHQALPAPTDHVVGQGRRDLAGAVDLDPEPEAVSRNLRRMSVAQLRDAIRTVTGGVYWSDAQGRDQLDLLAPTLGVPNYLDTTNEDLDASLVFQKFLGDGVRQICDEVVRNDLEMAPEDRVFIRFVDPTARWEGSDEATRDAIDRNLRYMKLRITGVGASLDDPEALARERWLLRSVTHATDDPARGWRAVCVGLMSSPEFFLY